MRLLHGLGEESGLSEEFEVPLAAHACGPHGPVHRNNQGPLLTPGLV